MEHNTLLEYVRRIQVHIRRLHAWDNRATALHPERVLHRSGTIASLTSALRSGLM